jgi:ribonuclease BN (tRNA processing enzyme)
VTILCQELIIYAPTMTLKWLIVCCVGLSTVCDCQQLSKGPVTPCCTKTSVVLLGTGTPLSEPERSGPAAAVVVDGTPYLVDAGPGIVRRINAAARAGLPGGNVSNFKTVFFTHLHSDHTLGYPDLLLAPWVLGRRTGLEVYGPEGLGAMTKHLLKAYSEDIKIRTKGLEREDPNALRPTVHEIVPGLVYQDDKVKVFAFRVAHGEVKDAFGYRFETADRTVVISGDTSPTDAIAANCHACDVLVHEVYSTKGVSARPKEMQNYHAHYHTSTAELGAIANQTHPGLLVLYHELLWDTSEDQLRSEMQAAYSGKFAVGHDLDVF